MSVKTTNVDPMSIMNCKRFDVAAKVIYLRFLEEGINSDFAERVYKHHLQVWNGLKEQIPRKIGIEEYKTEFDKIRNAVKSNTFGWNRSPILVNKAGFVINGSHRLAAAVFYNKLVVTEEKPDSLGELCPYDHLKKMTSHVPGGLKQKYSDAMAIEYCRLMKNKRPIYVVQLFPAGEGKDAEAVSILNKYGCVVYYKTVNFNKNGGENYIQQLYLGEGWAGGRKDKFSGTRDKAKYCYPKEGKTRVFLVEGPAQPEMLKAKKEIRQLYNKGKHSVHITDTWREAYRAANLAFNNNSIHFLNNMNQEMHLYPNFNKYMDQFVSWSHKGDHVDNVCIDSSAVMSVYGIRDCKDLDYLHKGGVPDRVNRDITSHNSWASHYPVNISNLVFNPENYFYYNEVKFVSLDMVRQMKLGRNEEKDQKDVKLVDDFLRK